MFTLKSFVYLKLWTVSEYTIDVDESMITSLDLTHDPRICSERHVMDCAMRPGAEELQRGITPIEMVLAVTLLFKV